MNIPRYYILTTVLLVALSISSPLMAQNHNPNQEDRAEGAEIKQSEINLDSITITPTSNGATADIVAIITDTPKGDGSGLEVAPATLTITPVCEEACTSGGSPVTFPVNKSDLEGNEFKASFDLKEHPGCSFDCKLEGVDWNGEPTKAGNKDKVPLESGGGAGGGSHSNSSLNTVYSLGSVNGATDSGLLSIKSSRPSVDLYSPKGIRVLLDDAYVTYDSNGVFQQATTDEAITSITDVVEGQGYTIRFKDSSNTEFKRVVVENPGFTAITETADPLLYQTERNGDKFTYNLPVASPGEYLVKLHFAENFHDANNQRKFDVTAEGSLILNDYDIHAQAGGKNKAIVATVPLVLADSELNLQFTKVLYQAEISGIELAKPGTGEIAGTTDDALFHDSRSGDFTYAVTVPNGNYNVSLYFVERYYSAANKRKFDVKAEGSVVLNDYDIYSAAAGTDKARVETFAVTVSDGTLNLECIGVVGPSKLAAFKVADSVSGTVVAAVNAGGNAFIAADSTEFSSDTAYTGGSVDAAIGTIVGINCGGAEYTAMDSAVFGEDEHYVGGKQFAGGTSGVRFKEIVGSSETVFEYTWVADPLTAQFGECILSYGNGLKKEGKTLVWSSDRSSYVETRTIRNASDQLLSKIEEHYEKFPFGFAKVKEVIDPDGANLQTIYTYHNPTVVPGDPAPDGYGLLKQLVRYDGYWEQYQYDSQRRITKKILQYQDSALGSESTSKVATFSYSTANPTETRVISIAGQEIERTYEAKFETSTEVERLNIRCTVPGAAWNAASNLVAKNCTYANDHSSTLLRGRTKWTASPDGTMTFYSYSLSGANLTTIKTMGEPNSGKTAIVVGVKTTTVTNGVGHNISEEQRDIASNLVLNSWTATATDARGRVTTRTFGDSTTETVVYVDGSGSGCGSCSGSAGYLIESQTDRNGIQTVFEYDGLGRQIGSTRLGITEVTAYDAVGRVTKRQRIGTDESVITLSESSYDSAGRLVSTKDALGNTTTYNYAYPSGGGTMTTMTLPNVAAGSGTQIELTYPDGRGKELSGTARNPVKYQYGTWSGGGQAGEWTQEIKLGSGTPAAETEWTKTYFNLAGDTVKVEYPDSAAATMEYNAFGQMVKNVDPDGLTTLYAYNGEGEQEITCIDLDQDGVIDYAGTDRITKTVRDVVTKSSTVTHRTITSIYGTDSSSTATTVATSWQDGYGNKSWQADALGNETYTLLTRSGSGDWTVTTTSPDGTQSVQTYDNGYLVSSETLSSSSSLLTSNSFAYDPHGRVETQTDARTGDTDYTYNNRDQVLTVTTPEPPSGGGDLVTTNTYDSLGRVIERQLPDGSTTEYGYDLKGNQSYVSGARNYTVDYTYDSQNRKIAMTTYQNGLSSQVTLWAYDAQRGWLNGKIYPDMKTTEYAYTPAGRLALRKWAREVSSVRLETAYSYNTAGDLMEVDYADSTPDVTTTYTRWGAKKEVSDVTGTSTFTYTATFLQDKETLGSVFYNNRVVTRKYETSGTGYVPGRGKGFEVGDAADPDEDYEVAYTYDNAGRLSTVVDSTATHTYSYLANSNLIASRSASVPSGFSSVNTYEPSRNLLASVENKISSSTISKYDYTYNRISQRGSRAQSGGSVSTSSTDNFTYKATGELTASSNSVNTSLNRSYDYDGAGNRTSVVADGVTTTYSVNNLNQYTEYTVGSGSPYVPSYDDDGNMTQFIRSSDGVVINLLWDAENRLISLTPAIPQPGDKKVENIYDGQSRRVQKTVSTYNGSSWQIVRDDRYLFDEWNLVAVYSANTGNLLHTYTWGLDLSGSSQGAGGVGGLLSNHNLQNANYYIYTYDANGNVSDVINSLGSVSAHYEYDPFGNVTHMSGVYAEENRFRFSTKWHEENGFYEYGHRYYSPELGRWLNRDPIGEEGGLNILAFDRNNPINSIDVLGLGVEWHHMLPQAVFNDAMKKANGLTLDIHDKKYGWVLDQKMHQEMHGKYGKWNDGWKTWLRYRAENKLPINDTEVKRQLAKMLRDSNYNVIFKSGVRAPVAYGGWSSHLAKFRGPIESKIKKLVARQAAEFAAKKAAKQGIKSVPFIGWGAAVIFFVCDVANPTVSFGEAVQSNIPYYGVAYDAYKVYEMLGSTDEMVEAELTSTIYEGGDRTIPPELLTI